MNDRSPRVDIRIPLALALVLVAALALRVYLLGTPQTELEADEAIVALMARHILEGERPVFYYMQPYLGSLEAYLVALSFLLFGSSTAALKLVPLVAGLAFVALVFGTGYRIGGLGVAVASGLYVAVPPAFLALWSLKARGGYVETLVMGQLLILLALGLAKRGSIGAGEGAMLGFLAGLGAWTNPLIGVYLVPVGIYLALALRRRLLGWWIVHAVAAAVAGAFPLLKYNLANGFATAQAMFGGTPGASEPLEALVRFFRYSLPILTGLAQASSSQEFFWPAFWSSPARRWPQAVLLLGCLLVLLVLSRGGGLAALVAGRPRGTDGRNLLALLLVVVPAAFVLSKFRDLVTEPRYLLPIYSAAPLIAAVVVPRRPASRILAPLVVAPLLALNLYSIATLDPQLNLPDTAAGSRASNRAVLIDHLLSRGIDHVYTDYWLAYPLAFESGERIVPSVVSGGFNRYIPYAHRVSLSPNPAFVFIAGSEEERGFLSMLADRGAKARLDAVSIYSVYWDVAPLDPFRP